uniref:Minichromosome loss protein Mcl1 middle region domain-containing protein n=1 Tax=Romanomermis culicivorax TaxID=13658 RepID=A0A915HJG4_ROMCU
MNGKYSPELYKSGILMDDEVSCDSNIGALKARYSRQFNDIDNDDNVTEDIDDFLSKKEKFEPNALSTEKVINGPVWTTKAVQKQFVVNSTPSTLDSRYMKWNDVAVIRQYNNDGESTIEVEFHDVTLHHAIQLNNVGTRFTMADVSAQFVAFCSQCDDGPARLHVIHFGAWDLSKEWTIDLPAAENLSCLAVTDEWLAVASLKYVWLFTSAGLQFNMFALLSEPVTMAACSNKLSVVYNESVDTDGSPLYSCLLIENPAKVCATQAVSLRIPLSSESQLAWLGFTDENTLCACDSAGLVLAYKHGLWIPIFNAQMINGDFFWIISIQERIRHIRGIRCAKSSNHKYPAVFPRPVVSTCEFKIPLCDSDTEKSTWEENLLLANSRSVPKGSFSEDDLETIQNELEKTKLQAVLKLFLIACNNDRDCRAYDIARLCDKATTLNALV